ncbi:MAG: hypothetical protein ACOC56_05865 [Atribacterota bacterium]
MAIFFITIFLITIFIILYLAKCIINPSKSYPLYDQIPITTQNKFNNKYQLAIKNKNKPLVLQKYNINKSYINLYFKEKINIGAIEKDDLTPIINEIKVLLERLKITNYIINDDLTVDVNGSVDLSYRGLIRIPFQFNKVNGHFYCENNKLTSLKGAPKEVHGNFWCYNNKLTSLKYLPKIHGKLISERKKPTNDFDDN